MQWISQMKSRVLDVFRGIDRDQDGRISQREFIESVLSSSEDQGLGLRAPRQPLLGAWGGRVAVPAAPGEMGSGVWCRHWLASAWGCRGLRVPVPHPEFPTNVLEMTAVANIFDMNGDGFIDYYEFVSALHPNRDPLRRTADADQIQDEVRGVRGGWAGGPAVGLSPTCPPQVNRQVAQCNCAKRFQVEQISANRYRVSAEPRLRSRPCSHPCTAQRPHSSLGVGVPARTLHSSRGHVPVSRGVHGRRRCCGAAGRAVPVGTERLPGTDGLVTGTTGCWYLLWAPLPGPRPPRPDTLSPQFGESQQLRMVRILRSTLMVRVGGGWIALDEFLVKNDPCRGGCGGPARGTAVPSGSVVPTGLPGFCSPAQVSAVPSEGKDQPEDQREVLVPRRLRGRRQVRGEPIGRLLQSAVPQPLQLQPQPLQQRLGAQQPPGQEGEHRGPPHGSEPPADADPLPPQSVLRRTRSGDRCPRSRGSLLPDGVELQFIAAEESTAGAPPGEGWASRPPRSLLGRWGAVTLWRCDPVVLWGCDPVALGGCGPVVLRGCGPVALGRGAVPCPKSAGAGGQTAPAPPCPHRAARRVPPGAPQPLPLTPARPAPSTAAPTQDSPCRRPRGWTMAKPPAPRSPARTVPPSRCRP